MRHTLLSMCASLLMLASPVLFLETARATSITVVSVDQDDRSATVNIFDNAPSPALPTVTIAATSPNASEVGTTNGQFTVTRTGATTSHLPVNYAIGGTAINGTDYSILPGSVTIEAGSSTATITVTPLLDALTDGAETVILTLSADAAYTVGTPSSATVNIFDNATPPGLPAVTIAATSPDASEDPLTNGQFTVTRTGATSSALTVNYAISGTAINGTDYSTLSGKVTIAAGSSTATVTVTPLVDVLTEGTETVILTLSANAAYNIVGSPKGFKDLGPPDPASTIGGNTGTTLGAQRLIAAQYAADLWADLVSSKVPILVDAKFDAPNSEHPDATDPFNSLDCTKNPPVIATAEPTTYHGNFPKKPRPNIWYPQALANSLTGNDLSTASDIRAYFNSSVGTSECLPDKGWYYGLDGNAQPDQFDFVTVVLREIAHGLGFMTTVDLTTGKKLGAFDDIFSLNLKDANTGELYSRMTNAERVLASKNTGNLHWIGAKVVAAHGGEVPMYAPSPVDLDFSVSNWDGSIVPGELMVPFLESGAAIHDVGLALELMQDLGWQLDPRPNGTVNVVATDATALEGVDTATFTVRRTVPTSDPLTVSYIVSGKATSDDYQPLSGSVEIPARESTATITVTPVFDLLTKEKNETVIVTLQEDLAYELGFPSSATVTIQNNVVKFGAGAAPAGEVGVPYNFDIPVSGGEVPYDVIISKGALPDGLTLSGLTIQGTPSSLAKTATFTIKVTDQQGVSVSKGYKITVLKAVNITTTLLKSGQINKRYARRLKATGGKKAYTWSETSGTLPASLTFDPATGRITGTPLAQATYNLTFKVTDALGGTDEQGLTLTIN